MFHGTPDDTVVKSIMTGGFKVGSRCPEASQVAIRNGAMLGKGVYVDRRAAYPIWYAAGKQMENVISTGGKVILSRAMLGEAKTITRSELGRVEEVVGADSWGLENHSWHVIRDPRQLKPMYVVHYRPREGQEGGMLTAPVTQHASNRKS